MSYSIIGILATIILIIINRDIFWHDKDPDLSQKKYRYFLMGVLAYYITDFLWGILEQARAITILYADTEIHFTAMAAAVMLWTQYVITYLESGKTHLESGRLFEKILNHTGRIFFAFTLVVVAVNLFIPVLFWFDSNGVYNAGPLRFVILGIQILMFLLTSIYTLHITYRSEGTMRLRHLTIGLFGLAMMMLIVIQVFYPLMPFYAMGYMLGTCVLHSFVVENEKEEYRRKLESAIQREQLQRMELDESREALSEALTSAEEASQAKSVFLSNMSHEIRTPMNAIIGLNNIAMQDPDTNEKTKGYLEKIEDSAQHLLEIINNILDMSRIESGRLIMKKEEFSLTKALEQVNTIIGGQCRDKNLTFDHQIRGPVSEYYIGDATKIKQVLINILGNAVKFTPEGGKVTFIAEPVTYQAPEQAKQLTAQDEQSSLWDEHASVSEKQTAERDGKAKIRFTIRDTGIGISEDYLPHLFDAFSQEDDSSTSQYGSTGLGMSITRSLVEMMDGNISVESTKNVGTTFFVEITLDEPVQRGESAQTTGTEPAGGAGQTDGTGQTARSELTDGTGLTDGTVLTDGTGLTDGTAEKSAAKYSKLLGKRILLAEDIPVNAEIMIMMLSSKQIVTEHAENGKLAVEMFENHAPGYYDAILMDMRMPEMDGLSATKAIRDIEREDAGSIPIIALTANAFDEDMERSMDAGMNAHLSKPVDTDLLFGTLEELISANNSH